MNFKYFMNYLINVQLAGEIEFAIFEKEKTNGKECTDWQNENIIAKENVALKSFYLDLSGIRRDLNAGHQGG